MGMNYSRYLIDARPYPERASQRLRARFPASRRLIGIASTWRPRHGLNRTASGRVGDPPLSCGREPPLMHVRRRTWGSSYPFTPRPPALCKCRHCHLTALGIAVDPRDSVLLHVRKDVERRRGHERHSTEVAGWMPGKYLRRRASAVRACASMPSSREMRAVTAATWRQASRAIRCVVTTFRNLCTERPPV